MPQFLAIASFEPHIASVTLNRPEAANALNTALAHAIKDYFTNGFGDARVILLSGNGKHFCAGADLKERQGMNDAAWKKQHDSFRAARDAVLSCPVPVIAVVHGAAYAGGLELALACDFIYAANDAAFALTEATLGIMPGMGGTQTLARAAGPRRAKEVIFSGRRFSAQDAYAWGIANRLCDPASLEKEALDCAKTIAANAPLSVKAIKKSIDTGINQSLGEALKTELSHYNTLLSSADRQEGINAWNEKRKPVFTGE